MSAGKYRSLFRRRGEVVVLRRIVANQPDQDLGAVHARISGYKAEEIAAGIDAGERQVILLAEDVASFDPPVRKNDRLARADGAVLTIESVDGSTHMDGDTILAYVCRASGAS
ncbi:hypothetical protein [Pararhizobium haloflavum]|uniref:hypothetical protein n=1 Tax=Pararhizobium haloflavum TaxID=2037914 RepID=UPI000C1A5085|nr:hypothetical protein [Pararhizobium haloflavum]